MHRVFFLLFLGPRIAVATQETSSSLVELEYGSQIVLEDMEEHKLLVNGGVCTTRSRRVIFDDHGLEDHLSQKSLIFISIHNSFVGNHY